MARSGLIVIVCLAGCVASDRRGRDSGFDLAWSEDARNSDVQSRDEYLKWVDSFYEGSLIVPGWTRRQAELCDSLDPRDAAVARERLRDLGRLLASEWAKDNRLRRIDSDSLWRYAGILAKARDAGCLIDAVDELLEEAGALIGIVPRRAQGLSVTR